MFGDGVSLLDITLLLKAIREKDLTLQVKVLDDGWEGMSKAVLQRVLKAVTSGAINGSGDIRLRLFLADKSA